MILMRKFVVVSFILLTGCEPEAIRACGHVCRDTQQRMVSYSNTDGCKCGALEDAGR